MKKTTLVLFAAVLLMFGTALSSCSKSNDDLIKEYSELCEEASQAIKDGDLTKLPSIAEKGDKIEKELKNRDLTEDQKEEVARITLQLADDMGEAAADALGL